MSKSVLPVAAAVIAVGVLLLRSPTAQEAPPPSARPGAGIAEREPGFRPAAYALVGARVVTEPGRVLDTATVVVRGNDIVAVGKDVEPPADAEVVDAKGLTVTAGWIDAGSRRGIDPRAERSDSGAGRPIDFAQDAVAETPRDNRKGMTPEFLASTALLWDGAGTAAWRKAGFTAQLLAPEGSLVTGRSVVVALNDAPRREAVRSGPVGLHVALRASGSDYPSTVMGAVAHVRQTLLDAEHHRRLIAHHERTGGRGAPPPADPALEALWPVLDGKLRVWFEADTFDEIHRALNFAEEFRLRPGIVGGAAAGRVALRLKALGAPVVLRVAFPDEPKPTPADPEPARLLDERRRQWRERCETLSVLAATGVPAAISTSGHDGQDGPAKFRTHLKWMLDAGVTKDVLLAALTTRGAEVLGVGQRMGRIAPGMAAHLTVWSGDPLAADAKVRMVFSEGAKFDTTTPGSGSGSSGGMAGGGDAGPSSAPAGKSGKSGKRPPGSRATKSADPEAKPEPKPDAKSAGADGKSDAPDGKADSAAREQPDPVKPDPARPPADAPDWDVELESDRHPAIRTGGNVLVRGATVLTVGPAGTLDDTDILVRDGKIAAIGRDLAAPEGVTVIDGTGRWVMPGIIDTHSHMAIDGGVNEMSLSVVPEVRIKDAVEGSDPALWRALSGGVTTARLLHGSANCIGGQDAVIKLRYGAAPQDLILADAPQGVKWALGENVKRRNGRFPNSRMGVEAVLLRSLAEARSYKDVWERYGRARAAGKDLPEPRRDLRLEALSRMLEGDIRIHCHCYRSDEILMLLRTADAFGVKVRSLQHALEAYKVAPEVAAHGCSVSTFSDWWAYKIEAGDAVPHNVALLNRAGVAAIIKSDSHELVRHLYLEAAKTVKYGGTPEDAALAAITLGAARQLGLEKRLGSIEVGKDADLAIFNGHPFNTFARVEWTLVDGEVRYRRLPPPDHARPVVRITADPEKTKARNVKAGDLRAALTSGGWRVIGGDGAWESRVVGPEGAGADDIGALVVRKPAPDAKDGAGQAVLLRDVAVAELLPDTQTGRAPVPDGLLGRPDNVGVPRSPRPSAPMMPPADAPLVFVRNAEVHTLTGPPLKDGCVLIREGRIAAVGVKLDPPPGAVVVDAGGLRMYPGLFDAGNILGLIEFGSARETQDAADSAVLQPDLVAATAVNPDSEMIPVTRLNGITACLTRPTGGLVSGQASVMALSGWTTAEMTLLREAGLFLALGRPPTGPNFGQLFPDGGLTGEAYRQDAMRRLRETFARAKLYRKAREAAARSPEAPAGSEVIVAPAVDPRMEALLAYADARRPVLVQADTRGEIIDAIKIGADLGVKVVVVGGRDSWKVTDRLAAARVPVILGPVLQLPLRYSDPYDAVYRCASLLYRAGVPFCFQTAGAANVRNLPYEAAAAAAHGLPPEEALRAITLRPAEILGVSDRMGTVSAGKRADLILTDGDPLQVTTRVLGMFVGGRAVPLESKQTRLYERYLGRLPAAAPAPAAGK